MGFPRSYKPLLWHCPRCDIYFIRNRTWVAAAKHYPEYRPSGVGPIKPNMDVCFGRAALVTEGPELAAYILGGAEAVHAMGRKVN